jgi:hypothetical protein
VDGVPAVGNGRARRRRASVGQVGDRVVGSGWGDRGLARGRRNQAGPKKHNAIFLFIKKNQKT